jgi:hypothetical protein
MYLRTTSRRAADGTLVRYLQLAHNEWDPVGRRSKVRVLYHFGREDALDRDAIRRLIGSLSRALPPGEAWPVQPGEQAFVLLAAWTPDHDLARACHDLSDLEVGPDGRLYVLSDKSASIARLADLDPGDPLARADGTWELPPLDGKPEGLAFTPRGRAIVALDTRKAKRNLVVLDPLIAVGVEVSRR